MPTYSIITVCKNSEKNISKTIKSVLAQSYTNFEYIIIDGKSTDGTISIINKFKKDNEIKFLSEYDNGIYDAMNKGISLANGKWCIFLNAGDCFASKDVLKNVTNKLLNEYDIIYGDTTYNINKTLIKKEAIDVKNLNFIKGMQFCHQSTFIKSNYIKKNLYSLDYRIASDYDFFIKSYINNAKFLHINECVSVFVCDGVSCKNFSRSYNENNIIKKKYFKGYEPNVLKSFMVRMFPNFCNYLYQKIQYRMIKRNN